MKRVFYKLISIVLIVVHLITFGPIRDAFAFNASSPSYKLNVGTLNEGGRDRAATTSKLWQDSLAEPCQ